MQRVKILKLVEGFAQIQPWNNVFAISRAVIASGTLITLLFNDIVLLIAPVTIKGTQLSTLSSPIAKISIYYLLSPNYELAKWISILILLSVIIGWYPKVTGILHWWVSSSMISSCILVDGGDHITAILTLTLIPICLTDRRKWHWTQFKNDVPNFNQKLLNLIALSTFYIIRIQVAIIYFNSGVAKLGVEEWKNGTALYYWFLTPDIGLSDWLKPFVMPLVTNNITTPLLTWGVIAFEILLFLGLVIDKKYRFFLLIMGLCFHFMIIIVHGLFSFFFAMAGALILYLGPFENGFKISR